MARDRTDRRPATTGWAIAKTMLVAAIVALGVSVWLAFTPMQNPGVQDCGTALGYIVFNRPDLRATPGETPGSTELALQATCRERVVPQLGRAALALGAALVVGIIGAVVCIIDDYVAYRRAPRFETLLRERPADAPGRYLRAPLAVAPSDVGRRLPPVEARDIAVLAGIGVTAFAVLVGVAGPSAVGDALGGLQWTLVALALASQVLGVVAASGQELLAGGGPPRLAAGVAVQSGAAQRLVPGLGPLGYDSYALVWRGWARPVALDALRRRQGAGVLGWLVVAMAFGLVAWGAPRPEISASVGLWVLLAATVVFVLVGLGRAGDRWRRLLVRPATPVALVRRRPDEAATVHAVRLGGQLAAAVALPLAGIASFALVVAACGGRISFAGAASVALAAMAAAALVPTPGGVGGVEAVVGLGLVLLGVPLASAAAAVVVWRVLTLWLPLAVGVVPFRRAAAASLGRAVLA